MNRTCGIAPSPTHPTLAPFLRALCLHQIGRSSMHREVFISWILPFQLFCVGSLSDLLIPAYEVSTHAKFLGLRRVFQQLAFNAAVSVAFPFSAQGRHPN